MNTNKKVVILTGSEGYIGKCLATELVKQGYFVIGVDSTEEDVRSECQERCYLDLADQDSPKVLANFALNCKRDMVLHSIIHMASWKDLTMSYLDPMEYYNNNLKGTIHALETARRLGIKNFVFSSSSAVYTEGLTGIQYETSPTGAPSPYGYSKLVSERIIKEVCEQYRINSVILRYFNPAGWDGYNDLDMSESMFGNIFNSLNENKTFTIFGGDYDSVDGTPVRDYIHIKDLVDVHISAIESKRPSCTYNIGTGEPITCKMICEEVQRLVPEFKYEIGSRRDGDEVGFSTCIKGAKEGLGWEPKYKLSDIIQSILDYIQRERDSNEV